MFQRLHCFIALAIKAAVGGSVSALGMLNLRNYSADFLFYVSLTVRLSITLANDQLDA